MNILWVTRYHSSKSLGGTEMYIDRLYPKLRDCYSVNILFIGSEYDIIQNEVIHVSLSQAIFDTEISSKKISELSLLVDDLKIDLIHFHTMGIAEFELSAAFGRPFGFTYHTPSWTCRRGDLLIHGSNSLCNGSVDVTSCMKCLIKSRLTEIEYLRQRDWLTKTLCDTTFFFLKVSESKDYQIQEKFQKGLSSFLRKCSFGIYPAYWCKEVLLRNGVQSEKLFHIPQAAGDYFTKRNDFTTSSRKFRMLYIGRIAKIKGIEDIINFAKLLEDQDVIIDLYGFKDSLGVDEYEKYVLSNCSELGIATFPYVSEKELNKVMDNYDAIIIPSLFPETGPMTYFEGKRKGLYIFCSDRIGQLEESDDTFIYESSNIANMLTVYRKMRRFNERSIKSERIESKISQRTFENVGQEHGILYEEVFKRV